jgi:hypothetical protein
MVFLLQEEEQLIDASDSGTLTLFNLSTSLTQGLRYAI